MIPVLKHWQAVRIPHHADTAVQSRIVFRDFMATVGAAIIHYHVFQRGVSLRKHTLHARAQIGLAVEYGRDHAHQGALSHLAPVSLICVTWRQASRKAPRQLNAIQSRDNLATPTRRTGWIQAPLTQPSNSTRTRPSMLTVRGNSLSNTAVTAFTLHYNKVQLLISGKIVSCSVRAAPWTQTGRLRYFLIVD